MNFPATGGPLLISTHTRPKRVAILFDAEKATGDEVDGGISFATRCWGGAYFPLIPFKDDDVVGDWWRVAEAADPDVVCALHPVGQPLLEAIVTRLAPLRVLVTPDDPRPASTRQLIDAERVAALSTAEIPGILAAQQRAGRDAAEFVIPLDSLTSSSSRSFALRNFGALWKDSRYLRAFSGTDHTWVDVDAGPNAALLKAHTKWRQVMPRDLARLYASPQFVPDRSDPSFWLVIGDSPLDAALAWNRSLFSEEWLGRSCLWLSRADAADDQMISEVQAWIGRHYFNKSGTGGRVLSYSMDRASLDLVAARVSRGSLRFTSSTLAITTSLFPECLPRLRRAEERTRSHQVLLRDEVAQVSPVQPECASASDGGWMVDLEIEQQADPAVIASPLPGVRIPRRAGVAALFSSERACRIEAGRLPSIEVSARDAELYVRVPTPEHVFQRCLTETVVADGGEVRQKFPSRYTLQPSDEGRQLAGVVGLFGSLWRCGEFFRNPFWRDLIRDMAGRPDDARQRDVDAVVQVLREEIAASSGTIDAKDSERVAGRIVDHWRLRPATASISAEEKVLRDKYNSFVGRYVRDHPVGGYFDSGDKFDEEAKEDFAALVENYSVLLQGIELTCEACFTKSWHDVDDLRREMVCAGCRGPLRMPVCPEWRLTLNELVAGAIRRRGVLAVLHALYSLFNYASLRSFAWAPSQDVRPYPSGERVTDADLLAIVNGRLYVGEVKTSPNGFDPEALDGARRLAELFRPDVLVLAAEGSEWPKEITARIALLSEDMRVLGIETKPTLLQW